ncbi:hypothetical protein, partial [Arthrospira platensis]
MAGRHRGTSLDNPPKLGVFSFSGSLKYFGILAEILGVHCHEAHPTCPRQVGVSVLTSNCASPQVTQTSPASRRSPSNVG